MPDMLGDWGRGMDHDLPPDTFTPLEQKMSFEKMPGAYDRPAPLQAKNKNPDKKGKKGKKNKKAKSAQKFTDHYYRSMASPATLRPGDLVLQRERKKDKDIRGRDIAYAVVSVQHFNGDAATDSYLHSPDRIEAIVRMNDASVGPRTWYGHSELMHMELVVLRPLASKHPE